MLPKQTPNLLLRPRPGYRPSLAHGIFLIVISTRILHHLTLGCSPTVAGEAIAWSLGALSQNAEHLAIHGLQIGEPCHRVAWLDITWFSGHLTEWGAISSTPIAFTERSMTRFSYQASFS